MKRITMILAAAVLMAVLLTTTAAPAFATHDAPGSGMHTGNLSCYGHDEKPDKRNDCGWHEGEGYDEHHPEHAN